MVHALNYNFCENAFSKCDMVNLCCVIDMMFLFCCDMLCVFTFLFSDCYRAVVDLVLIAYMYMTYIVDG